MSQLIGEGRLPVARIGKLRLIPWEEGRLCWALHRATADGGPPPGGKRPPAGAPLDPGADVDLTNWDPDLDWWEPVDLTGWNPDMTGWDPDMTGWDPDMTGWDRD